MPCTRSAGRLQGLQGVDWQQTTATPSQRGSRQESWTRSPLLKSNSGLEQVGSLLRTFLFSLRGSFEGQGSAEMGPLGPNGAERNGDEALPRSQAHKRLVINSLGWLEARPAPVSVHSRRAQNTAVYFSLATQALTPSTQRPPLGMTAAKKRGIRSSAGFDSLCLEYGVHGTSVVANYLPEVVSSHAGHGNSVGGPG